MGKRQNRWQSAGHSSEGTPHKTPDNVRGEEIHKSSWMVEPVPRGGPTLGTLGEAATQGTGDRDAFSRCGARMTRGGSGEVRL